MHNNRDGGPKRTQQSLTFRKIVHEVILLRTRILLRLHRLARPRIRLLPHPHQRHELLELRGWDDPPGRLLVAPGETLAHAPDQVGGVAVRDGLQRRDNVDRRVAVAGAARDPAGEVHHAGDVAGVGDEDDLEGLGLQVARPAGRDDGVHLRGAVDAQHGDLAIPAKLGGRVGVALDFGVDLGARGQESRVGEDFFGAVRVQESVPCGDDVERGGSSGGVDQGDGVVDGFFRVQPEGLGHVREGRLPLQRRAEIAVRAHRTQVPALRGDVWMQRFADLVCQEGRRGDRWIVARRNDCGILRELVAEVVIDDQRLRVLVIHDRRPTPAALVHYDHELGIFCLHGSPLFLVMDVGSFLHEMDVNQGWCKPQSR